MSSRKQNSKPHNFEVAQHDPFAAFKFRDYRLFTIGRLVLFVGSQMQTVAIGWELYERTNSAIALGGVSCCVFNLHIETLGSRGAEGLN
ncbi:hypothetical protein [Nostoc commune]|uniref:hypothetical protein n=1 Tax=Nostoc commune TaxID=1178 RepID=UPI0039BFAECD